MNERLKVINKINRLEEKHCKTCTKIDELIDTGSSRYCATQCSVGKKIKLYGDELLKISNRKAEKILKKGSSMTSTDIIYLLNKGYAKDLIGKSMGLSVHETAEQLTYIVATGDYRRGELRKKLFGYFDKGYKPKDLLNKVNRNSSVVNAYFRDWRNSKKKRR